MSTLIIRIAVATAVILLALSCGITPFGPFQPAALAASAADLTVTEISISPTDPVIGNKMTLTAAVKNAGDAKAANSYLTCYIDDAIIETSAAGEIDSGLTATVDFLWTAAPGQHTVKAIIDPSDIIAESNENNNTLTYSFTVASADLVVKSITWSPQNPSKNDLVKLSVTIANEGSITSTYTDMNVYIDDAARTPQAVPQIAPGKTLVITCNWLADTGRHTIRAAVDIANNTKESDENNNELTIIFDTLLPDLTVEKLTWTPANPTKESMVTFLATITNQGSGRMDANDFSYYIDDEFIKLLPCPALIAGASCNVTFTWTAVLGKHKVGVKADHLNGGLESNEANNLLEADIEILQPDLIVSKLTWAPNTPAAGDTVTFTATVKNQGAGGSVASRAAYFIDNQFIGFLDYPALAAGEEQNKTFTWAASGGSHLFYVKADYQATVEEDSDDNNRLYITLPVITGDLVISKIAYTPEKPNLDDTVTFTITVKNQGKGITTDFRVGIYMDDTILSAKTVNPLAYNASTDLTYTWKIQPGHHVFKATANYDGNMKEDDRKNNTMSIPIAPDMPDLAITSVIWSPLETAPGQEVTFNIEISNLGTMTAGASRLIFYVDGSPAGYHDLLPVAPGEKTTQFFTWAASENRHNISIVADSKDQITEIDEVNNTVTVNVPPPDLVVRDIAYAPQKALSGDVVTITAYIVNTRGSNTQETTVRCCVDGTSIGVKPLGALEAGQTGEVTFQWTAEAGGHTITISADVLKANFEMDETNNEASVIFTTTSPDLVLGDIRWDTSGQSGNKEIKLNITVKNDGGCDSGVFSVQCSFDGATAVVYEMASIPTGKTADLAIVSILNEGPHNLTVRLDNNGEISEIDEGNNTGAFSFSTVVPDLIVRTTTWAPMTANIGDVITITVKVENTGPAGATAVHLSLMVDGAEAGTADIQEIASGAAVTADFTWTALEGEHTIVVTADALQTITESNESNNSKTRTITFSKPEVPEKKTPIITLNATTGGGLIQEWWWIFLAAGGALGLGILYSTIKNLRKK